MIDKERVFKQYATEINRICKSLNISTSFAFSIMEAMKVMQGIPEDSDKGWEIGVELLQRIEIIELSQRLSEEKAQI